MESNCKCPKSARGDNAGVKVKLLKVSQSSNAICANVTLSRGFKTSSVLKISRWWQNVYVTVILVLQLTACSYGLGFQDEWPTTKINTEEPEFEGPIGNLTTPVGREAILSCSVHNLGKYKVGWLKAEDQTILTLHTRVVTHNTRISVTHDNLRTWQLRIRQLKESDRGCYMCQINTSTMKKNIGCLDVHVPPDIINDDTSGDVAVSEGDNATLWCRATGHPPPRITWRREDGESIQFRKGPQHQFIRVDSYNGSSLHFWRLERRQMGAYLCIASNDVPPAVSKRISLSVNFAPTIRVPNQLLGAPLNTDVQLQCQVEAYPNTINYWVKSQTEMLLDGPKYSIREVRNGYKVNMWLIIRSFSSADIGTYNCVSTNSLGRADGTLRLYEIKLPPHQRHGNSDNHVNILEGLSEAAKSNRNLSNDANSRHVSFPFRQLCILATSFSIALYSR